MAQELTIKTDDKPTIFNKEMAIGALAGNIIGAITGGIIGGVPGAFAGRVAGIAIVGAFAGYKRKQAMEREAIVGKPVGEPSLFNKDTLLGGLLGLTVTGLLSGLGGRALLGTTKEAITHSLAAHPILAVVAGLTAVAATFVVGPIVGAIIGGRHGKARMENEVAQAQAQALSQNISQGAAPEVSQAIDMGLAASQAVDKSYGQQVIQDRLLAAAQQNAR